MIVFIHLQISTSTEIQIKNIDNIFKLRFIRFILLKRRIA